MNTPAQHFAPGSLRSPCRERGFNMIEVLVALAVLSVGLIGLAGLQSIGLRFNHQSYLRTQAVIQAYDIADRIRANWRCVADDTCQYSNVGLGVIPAVVQNCISDDGSAVCSQHQLATYDVAQWNAQNGHVLTNGRGALCRGTLNAAFACTPDAAGSQRYWIAVTWIENDLNMRIDLEVDMPREL
jgi:type IV pilus assembly protein PilV